MKTEKFTFNTIQEVQAKQADLKNIYGEENVITSIGSSEEYNYTVTFSVFN